jgi:hypothetical protein
VQSGTTWTQQAELTASDGAAADDFGWSVSLSDGTAIVGALRHQVGTNVLQGAAYVFVRSGTTWTQQAELTASDGAANDFFGGSVSLSGGTALVGQVPANTQQGVAYVFVRSGTTWTQQAELTASDGDANDQFGWSVSVSGGTALVGAYQHQVGANAQQGAAYVFVQSGTTWSQQAELTASDGAANDQFGWSVSVSGSTALVGADSHQIGANQGQGAAYVFVQSGTTWTQQAALTASDGAAMDELGTSVSVSGGTALVGAQSSNARGAAYVFVQSGTTWTQQAKLTASDGVLGDVFGWSVSVRGGTALVGAYQHRVGANVLQGAAYVFVAESSSSSSSSSTSSGMGGAPATTTGTGAGGTTGTTSSSSTGSTGGGGGGEWIPLYGRGCSFVAGEPTPDERSLLASVAAMVVVVGLRRRPRRGGSGAPAH